MDATGFLVERPTTATQWMPRPKIVTHLHHLQTWQATRHAWGDAFWWPNPVTVTSKLIKEGRHRTGYQEQMSSRSNKS